jgi:hypothetical protein
VFLLLVVVHLTIGFETMLATVEMAKKLLLVNLFHVLFQIGGIFILALAGGTLILTRGLGQGRG